MDVSYRQRTGLLFGVLATVVALTSACHDGAGAPALGSGAGPGPAYRVSAPDTAGGLRADPTATTTVLTKYGSQLGGFTGAVGGQVSGSVDMVYDDPNDHAYVIFVGLNGSGFDPATLRQRLSSVPQPVLGDGQLGNGSMTHNWTDIDPGPHGGTGVCDETLFRLGMLAVESSSCTWMTPATVGAVLLFPDEQGTRADFGFSAGQVADLLRRIRPDVERVG